MIIDTENYVDNTQPTTANQGVLAGPAQTDATITNVINDGLISPEGRYSSAFPLRDGTNRLLVSKGFCQLEITVTSAIGNVTTEPHPCIEPWLSDPTAVDLPPSYGIWMYDRSNTTEKLSSTVSASSANATAWFAKTLANRQTAEIAR